MSDITSNDEPVRAALEAIRNRFRSDPADFETAYRDIQWAYHEANNALQKHYETEGRAALCHGKAHIPITTCATCGCFIGSVADLRPAETTALPVAHSKSQERRFEAQGVDYTTETTCGAERGGLVCTRPKGHDGQHEAWGLGTHRPRYLIESWTAMPAQKAIACIWRSGCKHPEVCSANLRCVPGGIDGQS